MRKHIPILIIIVIISFTNCKIKTELQFLLENEITNTTIPEYLSIKADTSKSYYKIFKFIQKNLEHLLSSYPTDKNILTDYINIFLNNMTDFTLPDSWHTTCLYIGENYSQLNSTIYQNFIEGININLTSSTFVYIPGKIMTAPVFFDNFTLIDNKYPHVTLLLGEYRAVDSNYVLKSIFDEFSDMKKLYENGKIRDNQFLLEKRFSDVEIHFEDLETTETVDYLYLLKFGKSFTLEAYTIKNYFTQIK